MNKKLSIFVIVFLIAWFLGVGRPTTLKTEEPIQSNPSFEIGDCITHKNYSVDEFGLNKPIILRIIEVGKKSYKFAYVEYTEYCLKDNSYCHVLDFYVEDLYVKTSCNP